MTVLAAAATRPSGARGRPAVRDRDAAADAAAEALMRTPTQLDVLGAAGVVDAGGRGLVVILDALVGVVTGQAPERAPFRTPGADERDGENTGVVDHVAHAVSGQDYEVMYLVAETDDVPGRAIAADSTRTGRLGDHRR